MNPDRQDYATQKVQDYQRNCWWHHLQPTFAELMQVFRRAGDNYDLGAR